MAILLADVLTASDMRMREKLRHKGNPKNLLYRTWLFLAVTEESYINFIKPISRNDQLFYNVYKCQISHSEFNSFICKFILGRRGVAEVFRPNHLTETSDFKKYGKI